VTATIYVAGTAGKTIAGSFNVRPTTVAFFSASGRRQMILVTLDRKPQWDRLFSARQLNPASPG
jgi:hypothetical protein